MLFLSCFVANNWGEWQVRWSWWPFNVLYWDIWQLFFFPGQTPQVLLSLLLYHIKVNSWLVNFTSDSYEESGISKTSQYSNRDSLYTSLDHNTRLETYNNSWWRTDLLKRKVSRYILQRKHNTELVSWPLRKCFTDCVSLRNVRDSLVTHIKTDPHSDSCKDIQFI